MIELFDLLQYEKLVVGCWWIGFFECDVYYYVEYIMVDIGYVDGWLNNVIVLIGKKYLVVMEEVFFGVVLCL